jgi:hypothetical protein
MTPVFALMFGRLLNAFFAASLEEEIRTFVFVILGVAGAAGLFGALLPCPVLPRPAIATRPLAACCTGRSSPSTACVLDRSA